MPDGRKEAQPSRKNPGSIVLRTKQEKTRERGRDFVGKNNGGKGARTRGGKRWGTGGSFRKRPA